MHACDDDTQTSLLYMYAQNMKLQLLHVCRFQIFAIFCRFKYQNTQIKNTHQKSKNFMRDFYLNIIETCGFENISNIEILVSNISRCIGAYAKFPFITMRSEHTCSCAVLGIYFNSRT